MQFQSYFYAASGTGLDSFFSLPRFRCAQTVIDDAPAFAGIYGLFEGEELIYIGRATSDPGHTIRDQLLLHRAGNLGDCTRAATHYTFEISRTARTREIEVLADHAARTNGTPRCNREAA